VVATIVMSAGFLAAQRAGTIGTLPPQLIVEHAAPELPPRPSRLAAVVAHLGYGAAAGAAYAFAPRKSVASGVAFGVLVWASGYELWVPAAGILPPAHRDDRARALTIFGAHLVYGAALGWASRRSARR
jgi:fucose permease